MRSTHRRVLAAAVVASATGVAAWALSTPEAGLATAALAFSVLVAYLALRVGRARPDVEGSRPVPVGRVSPDAAASVPGAPPPPERPPSPDIRAPRRLDCPAVLQALLDNARAAGPSGAAHLWLEDPATDTLRLVSAVGPLSPAREPVPVEGGPLGDALAGGVATLEEVSRSHDQQGETRLWRYAVPVLAGDARGVAAIDFASPGPPDTDLLNRVAAVMRGPLAGCLAVHLARQQTQTAEILLEMARELSRLLDPEEVVSSALAKAMALSEAITGSVMLLDEHTGHMRIAAARGLPREVVETTEVSEGEGIAGWVLASRQPLLVEDLQGKGRHARRHGVRSAISVPIADEDGILGVLNVGSGTFPARFTSSHTAALEVLARQTAAALRNARAVSCAREVYFATLKALALALETKDPYASGATERVLHYASAIGRRMGLDDSEQHALEIAALLHDIGMSAAGDALIVADRPLSTVERGILKMHPVLAAEILEQAPALREVVPIVYHHHEWYDGRGYVGGLSGASIPLGARILAAADAFVAMTSERPYRRRALSTRDALEELQDKAGTQFDPDVVAVFRDVVVGEGGHPRNGEPRLQGRPRPA
ncbi:MAG: GAF domain-containing protein [Coriobacteriia bacterium]|nr:GAF domain-containing protein [Coriobacteriia bacterium]